MLTEEDAIDRTLKDVRPLLHRPFVRRLPILTYHHVGPSKPDVHPLLTVAPDDFAKQVAWLAHRGYSSITTPDWTKWLAETRPLPKKPVLITFDDGYDDIAQYALPTLSRYGFTAVVYIITGLIGKTNEWDQRIGRGELRLMTAQQIKEWAAKGIEIGSHTRDHPDLRSLSQSELEDQVFGSAADLQRILGKAPASFAYPFGHFNQAVRDCVARAYQTSVTVVERLCSDQDDPWLMPRLWTRPTEGLSIFKQRVKLGHALTLHERTIARMGSCKAIRWAKPFVAALRSIY
jgi:peptidoglycan/xylan/chitin deacetylase (PgdA/CDA1 family)